MSIGMRVPRQFVRTLVIPAAVALVSWMPRPPADFIGTWQGTLTFGQARLRIVLYVREDRKSVV